MPPVPTAFTASLPENETTLVWRRSMPDVAAPFASTLARKNSTRASAVSGRKGAGVLLTSGLVRRKSRFKTSIWLAICASAMFCAAVFQTTCTTTGIRVTPGRSAAPSRSWKASAWFSISSRARAYSGNRDSNSRCTSIVAQVRTCGVRASPPSLPMPPSPSPPSPPPIPPPGIRVSPEASPALPMPPPGMASPASLPASVMPRIPGEGAASAMVAAAGMELPQSGSPDSSFIEAPAPGMPGISSLPPASLETKALFVFCVLMDHLVEMLRRHCRIPPADQRP